MTFFITDIEDALVNSYLAIDGLEHCPAPTSYGDFNYDCQCNNFDFAIISKYWLYDCDPSSGYTPSQGQCESWQSLGSPGDTNNDDIVDIADLRMMGLGWLGNQ